MQNNFRKLDINRFTTTTTTTTTTTIPTTTTTTRRPSPPRRRGRPRKTEQDDKKFVNLLLGLPELPEPEEKQRNSPANVFSGFANEKEKEEQEEDDYDYLDEKLQLLPPKEASDSVARFHKDPEQPHASASPSSSDEKGSGPSQV